MWRRFSPQNNFPFSGNAVRAQGERNCKKTETSKNVDFRKHSSFFFA
jgi:hypothetical protein